MADFDEVVSRFWKLWQSALRQIDVANWGIRTYHEFVLAQAEKYMREERPDRVPEVRVGLLSERYSRFEVEIIRAGMNSLAIVLPHAIFEELIDGLLEVSVDSCPASAIKGSFGDQTLTLLQALANPIEIIRSGATAGLNKRSLPERATLVFKLCLDSDQDGAQTLAKAYGADVSEIDAIDSRRHRIMHELFLEGGYEPKSDFRMLERLACLLAHLVANCILKRGFGTFKFHSATVGPVETVESVPSAQSDAYTWKDLELMIANG